MAKPHGYDDFMERLRVIEDEGDDLSAAQKFAARLVAIFDYLLVSESEGDPARIPGVMREIGMVDAAAILEKQATEEPVEHAHTLGMSCPVDRCRWPMEPA